MTTENGLCPMRWPCGPLEIALRRRIVSLLPDVRASLLTWLTPESLELLRGTPVNCLIVPWAAGAAEDEEQQSQLSPLVARAKVLGLHVVGRVHPPADLRYAAHRGSSAGLLALASPSLPEETVALPVIEWAERDKIHWNRPSTTVVLGDSVWPSLRGSAGGRGKGNAAIAGPTGIPWLDSNGWLIQWAIQKFESKRIWLGFEPEQTDSPLDTESYLLALADSESRGAQWIVSLDNHFRSAIDSRQAVALERWRKIAAALEFFRQRSVWNEHRPKAALGIAAWNVDGEVLMNGEILNLLGRRQVPFRLLGKDHWKNEETQGLVAILSASVCPNATEHSALLRFVEHGGLLIVPSTWEEPEGTVVSHDLEDTYSLYRVGKGRLAWARESWRDPYQVAEEVHLLMSRRNDLFRLGNGASMSVHCTGSSDGRTTLIHLVDFGRHTRRSSVSLWVREHFRVAHFWELGSTKPISLAARPEQSGYELALPPFATYAAVELER